MVSEDAVVPDGLLRRQTLPRPTADTTGHFWSASDGSDALARACANGVHTTCARSRAKRSTPSSSLATLGAESGVTTTTVVGGSLYDVSVFRRPPALTHSVSNQMHPTASVYIFLTGFTFQVGRAARAHRQRRALVRRATLQHCCWPTCEALSSRLADGPPRKE